MKILKDEYLFDSNGLHILDDRGIATRATEDVECEVDEQHLERVIAIVIKDRARRGLDANGDIIIEESLETVSEHQIPEEQLQQPVLTLVEDIATNEESQQETLELNDSDEVI